MKRLIKGCEYAQHRRVAANIPRLGARNRIVGWFQAVQARKVLALAVGTTGLLCGCITTEEEIALRRLNAQRETHPAYYELERRRMMNNRDRPESLPFK